MERAAGLRLRQLVSGLQGTPGRKGQCCYQVRGVPVRLCSSLGYADNEDKALLDRIIRVDHAGEYGANRIYAGQMAVLGRSSVGPIIQHMWDQEKEHLKKFDELMVSNRVRPTILLPFWNVAGFVLGAGTALLGKKGAMACTVAVEESISNHYNNQIRALMERDPEKHRELLQAPAYSVLKGVIQVGCRTAVYLSERL
ncbi:5-demethoxyubiquinone hydroxylase, mitochondrial isoform X2 [Pseudophryne corroboree]|uniref:5-demethoxyubiquinone hydroxylase, mitochondrial isoform X2 n=1 Tax=Pseudophryne corroboree TaxID=495146 RepID=UPI00308217C0